MTENDLAGIKRRAKIVPGLKYFNRMGGWLSVWAAFATDDRNALLQEVRRLEGIARREVIYGGASGGGVSKARNQCYVPRDYDLDAWRYFCQPYQKAIGLGVNNLFPRDLPMMTSETLKFIDSRLKPKYGIRNLKKVKLGKKTTVELDDGRKGVATLNPVDVPDPYVAFALAYTKSQFENSTAFYNFVDKMVKKNKRYGVYLKGVKLKAKKEEDK